MKMKGWILLLAIAIGGCTKDNTTINNLPGNTLSATIDGGYWTATDVQQQLLSGTQQLYGARTPTASESTSILIKINNYSGLPGNSPIDSTTTGMYTQDSYTYPASSGIITVTEDNGTHIAGTFSLLVGATSFGISGGKFDIKK